jgi:hypothetical protein
MSSSCSVMAVIVGIEVLGESGRVAGGGPI